MENDTHKKWSTTRRKAGTVLRRFRGGSRGAADPPEPAEHPGHLVIYDEDEDGQDFPVDDEYAVSS